MVSWWWLPGCRNNTRADRIKFPPHISVRPGKMGKCTFLPNIRDRSYECSARWFLKIHMCENDPRLPHSELIKVLKEAQFPERKPLQCIYYGGDWQGNYPFYCSNKPTFFILCTYQQYHRYFYLEMLINALFYFQMVQAIQVLRFHLLELEKVSKVSI